MIFAGVTRQQIGVGRNPEMGGRHDVTQTSGLPSSTAQCTGRGLTTSRSPVQEVIPTVPDQETEETQPYAPKAGASTQVWEERGRKKKFKTSTP
jgi:hypothetical protein